MTVLYWAIALLCRQFDGEGSTAIAIGSAQQPTAMLFDHNVIADLQF